LIPNIADLATVAHVRTSDVCADTNDVIGGGDTVSGCIAQGRVEAARNVALGRLITHGRVKAAAGVAEERIKTIGRVVAAGGIMQERSHRWQCCLSRWCCWKGPLLREPC
jgi:hypothetical protein